jgi:hypothetical protein
MRPLRALAVLMLLLAAWSGWRIDAARATYAAMLADRRVPPARGTELPLLYAWATAPTWRPDSAPVDARAPLAGHAAVVVRPIAQAVLASIDAAVLAADRPLDPVQRAAVPPPVTESARRAYVAAEQAYRALAGGDRRAAAAGFAAALAAMPDHPNAGPWRAELARLERRWSLEAYSLIRGAGDAALAPARPLFGGGQSGARIGYMLDPLASRPLELFARLNVGQDWLDVDGRSAQAAIGAGWRPLGHNGPAVAAERLVGVGRRARDAWALRLSGGAARAANAALPVDLSAYAEATVVGARRRDWFAGGQAHALHPLLATPRMHIAVGAGLWGGIQHADTTTGRLDIGPSAQLTQRVGGGAIDLRAEYRARIAGTAAPGSGPVVTVSARY